MVMARLAALTFAALLLAGAIPVLADDCNGNGIDDAQDIALGTSSDCQVNGIPDECDPPGDFDADGAYGLADVADFVVCLSGPCAAPPCDPVLYGDPCCVVGDFDHDADVDVADFGSFQRCYAVGDGTLVITEFMASNDNTLADADGDYSDWIEIHNPSSQPVNLGGWYLTDDASEPAKWQFPSVNLGAGNHLVVFASDKDRAGPELHTNFKLSGDGEYLALVEPDGSTVAHDYSPAYPQQVTDTSYGLAHGLACLDPRYFTEATPEETNDAGFAGFAQSPTFSRDGGTFVAPFDLVLGSDTPGAVIRYTLDGSIPTMGNGMTYAGPVSVGGTTRILSRVFSLGWAPSPVVTKVYLKLAGDVQSFDSNLPLVVVDTFGFDINSESDPTQPRPYRPAMAVFIDTAVSGRAAITDAADFAGYAGMHVRGHSSSGFDKKQYKLETWDEYDDDTDTWLLGFPAESDWILQAPYSDKTLMRNVLAYKWSNDIGRWAVDTRFVEMFLNTDGGEVTTADYVGVYVLMENIKRGSDRLDIAKLDSGDNAEPEITGGYIFKKDRLNLGEYGFWTQELGQLAYVDPAEDEITTAQATWLSNWIYEFETTLMGSSFADPAEGYAKYIDVDSFIDHHILVEMMKNIDGYRLSTYMHKDRGDKLNMGPVWDYNLCTGNADYSEWGIDWYQKSILWYYSDIGEEHAWYARLMQDPEYMLRYADRWFELREDKFSAARLVADIDASAALLAEAAARNFARWEAYVNSYTGRDYGSGPYVWTSILNAWVWPNWYHGSPANPHTYQMEIDWVKTWLTGNGTSPGEYSDRLAWFDANLGVAPPPVFNSNGGAVEEGFVLTMAMPPGVSGTILYTLNGADPRVPAVAPATFMAEGDAKRVLVPTGPVSGWTDPAFDHTAWMSGGGGVGYETTPGGEFDFTSLIGVDVQPEMYLQNATCYVRIPFGVSATQLAVTTQLTLRARFDDAFVAYLNGVEVAQSEFVPTPLSWDSAATYYREDELAVEFEDFDLSSALGLLVEGDGNLLAIHALNSSPDSSDFLISLELLGGSQPGQIAAGAADYTATGPITLTESTRVRARVLDGSVWGALNEAVFAVGPPVLLINEFMADNDATIEDPDEPGEFPDWVELYNPGVAEADLSGMYLTDDLSDPTQWRIPDGVTIPSGGFLLFWADGDEGDGDTHANFKLGKGGEEIGLFDIDARSNAAIDTISFGPQTTDISSGRNPDGEATWDFFASPTPGASNGA